MRIIFALLGLSMFLGCLPIAHAQELTPEQQAVWEREQAYCRHMQNNDLEGYMSLWDEQFAGWPQHDAAPVTKSDIRQEVANEIKAGEKQTCNSALKRVNVLGDVAATFYVLEIFTVHKDGSKLSSKYRITHTWRKSGKDWKIIAGMSSLER
ncbi:MAG TPA: nuclear transport factor 2 family protein [Terriglobales bacterium]|nr:nuclear transport factor 2 family protein [Terriglobales bacterium]